MDGDADAPRLPIGYTVYRESDAAWVADGRCAEAPVVGDRVYLDGQTYVVTFRKWHLTDKSCAGGWQPTTDLTSVELIVQPAEDDV